MKTSFGICADLHTDFIHDGPERVKKFIKQCDRSDVDFYVQLGDFCTPGELRQDDNRAILGMLQNCSKPFYHILGNHDMDANSKEDVLAYLGQKQANFSFDCGEVHFVVLDASYYKSGEQYYSYDHGNYKKDTKNAEVPVVPPKVLAWLKDDLANAKYPSVIFSHQSLIESRTGIRNCDEFRQAIADAPKGVLMAMCGHEHVDRAEYKDGVWYVCLNSMSYYWAGEAYDHTTYGEIVEKECPLLRFVFPYREPLFATVTIDNDSIYISGTESEIVGMLPEKMSFKKEGFNEKITAVIQNRKLSLQK